MYQCLLSEGGRLAGASFFNYGLIVAWEVESLVLRESRAEGYTIFASQTKPKLEYFWHTSNISLLISVFFFLLWVTPIDFPAISYRNISAALARHRAVSALIILLVASSAIFFTLLTGKASYSSSSDSSDDDGSCGFSFSTVALSGFISFSDAAIKNVYCWVK